MSEKQDYSISSRRKHLTTRNLEVARLRASAARLSGHRIDEYINAIAKAYESSTIVNRVALVRKESEIRSLGYRSIGLYQAIRKDQFVDKTYYWLPFFTDVGRAIARGEQKYIQHRLDKQIRGIDKEMSFSAPSFGLLRDCVSKLLNKGYVPNVMLAPVQIMVKLFQEMRSQLHVSEIYHDHLSIEGCDVRLIWSHKYAPSRSFVIFDSSMAEWHAIEDPQDRATLSLAIGESKDDPNKILYFAETVCYFKVLDAGAFVRINLSR